MSRFARLACCPCVDASSLSLGGGVGGGSVELDICAGGYLFKKGNNATAEDSTAWRKRWVKLEDVGDEPHLKWYVEEPSSDKAPAKGSMSLLNCVVEAVPGSHGGSRYIFEVKHAARGERRVFYATTHSALKTWVKDLKLEIGARAASSGGRPVEGYFFKKGSGKGAVGRHNWKRRYFVLKPSTQTLEYYESPKSTAKRVRRRCWGDGEDYRRRE